MSKADQVEAEGTVSEVLANSNFRVKVDTNGATVLCTLAGKMRQNQIRVVLGDRVKIAMSPFDLSRGRIVYRSR